MIPADNLTDFELEAWFTTARKTRGLAGALRLVFAEMEAAQAARLPPSVVAVLDVIARRWNTTRTVLLGRTEKQLLKRPRVIAWWLLHYRFDEMSYPALGRVFGGRNHAGIWTQVAEFAELMKDNNMLAALVADVEAAVLGQMQRAA